MATVRVKASESEQLSAESLAQLNSLRSRTADTSDIPEASPQELREIARQVREKHKKRMFSLRLERATIEWWQSLGEGYTGLMARLLDEARKHPDWIKQCMQ